MKVAALVAVTALVIGCDAEGRPDQAAAEPPQVDVAQVLVEPVTITESFTGRLEAPETIELRPRVSGYIQEVSFEEGELVEAGDVLFRIEPRPYEARVKAARAELEEARTRMQLAAQEAERARSLMEDRAVSREEHDQRQAALARARARVSMAEAALETAELDLEYTRVTAPVSGRAGRALVTKGNLANADQSVLTTIVSVDPLHVYFVSNESAGLGSLRLARAASNTEVAVTLEGSGESPRTGRLDYVDNRLDAGTGTLTFRAVLPNPLGTLRPGQFARVEMPVARLKRAVLVDRKAVLTDQDRRFVYVVGDDSTVERRPVRPGRGVGDLLVIDEGLAGDEDVVVNGTQRVAGAGVRVDPNTVAMRDESSDVDAEQALVMSQH
jgi:multidrug efflux system membrane fusion protein